MPRSLDEQRDHDQSGVNATPPRSHPAGSMPPPAGRDADRSGVMTKRVGLYLRVSTKNGQEEQVAGAPTRKAALCARHRHIDPQRQTLWRAEWIRTFSSALDRQQFVVSSEFGRSTVAHGHPSSCRPRRTDRVVGRCPERRHSPPGSWARRASSPRTTWSDARFFELASVTSSVPLGNSNVARAIFPTGFVPRGRQRSRPAIIR